MSDTISFDVTLAHKIKRALIRNNIPDAADLDWLAAGDNIAMVRKVRLGHSEIVRIEHVTDPSPPQRLSGRNRYGHYVFELTCLNLYGEGVITTVEMRKNVVSEQGRLCLLSKTEKSFNNRPKLASWLKYKVVLMPVGRAVTQTAKLVKEAQDEYDYILPPVDVVPLLLCQVSNLQLLQTGFRYIGAASEPVEEESGRRSHFYLHLPGRDAGEDTICLAAYDEAAVTMLDKECALVFVTR